ncbi:MAG: hypothetical protein U0T82_07660 [Bacteroidales bacterium]
MKENTFIFRILFALVITASLAFLNSCGPEEEDPPYVGTWAAFGEISDTSGTLEAKEEITLGKDTYKNILYIKNPSTQKWVALQGLKGSLSLSGTKLSLNFTSIGLSTFDIISGLPTGNIQYYQKGTENFDALLEQSGFPAFIKCEYVVTGNTIILYMDVNGDFVNEAFRYTRQ